MVKKEDTTSLEAARVVEKKKAELIEAEWAFENSIQKERLYENSLSKIDTQEKYIKKIEKQLRELRKNQDIKDRELLNSCIKKLYLHLLFEERLNDEEIDI